MRNHKPFIGVILILGLAIVAVTLSACAKKPVSGHQTGQKKVAPALEKEILADAEEDIRGIEKVTDDPTALSQHLDGQALESMSKEVSLNNSRDKVKLRRYENIKLSITYYAKGIAGASFEFDDASYYTKKGDTGKRSLAIADKRRLALALAKRGGRWKIINILQPASDSAQ